MIMIYETQLFLQVQRISSDRYDIRIDTRYCIDIFAVED